MNLIAATFNIILFVFTCLQIINNGISGVSIYIILALLLLLVPILNLIMILSGARNSSWYSFHVEKKSNSRHEEIPYIDTFIKIMVLTFNLVLFGISCWAIVDQYPHPKGDGVVFFTVIVLLTPVISLLTISRNRENIGHYA